MRRSFAIVALLCGCAVAAERKPGPWDLIELRRQPKVEWIRQEGNIRLLTYNGEPLNGRPTRVFAYYGLPKAWAEDSERVPAMVLVHGGGGRAFREWVAKWTLHGYAAIAMDLSGRDSAGQRHYDGMPDQGHENKFHTLGRGLKATWPYHAVAAVIRAVSLLEHQPEVNTGSIGITGISWGGYLTCIAAGLDDRLKVAIPVYGCGFLHVDSAWRDILHGRMTEEHRALWVDNFDPSQYLGRAHMPMLWINGTNDFGYPLSIWQRSYRLPRGSRALRVKVRMPHGHRAGWEPVEIGIFADQHLLETTPLPQIGAMQVRGKSVSAPFESQTAVLAGRLHYTTDTGPWQKRNWRSRPAAIDSGRVTATLPDARPVVFFLNITDLRRATVSAEHQTLE